ncbi:hypothetical protein GWK08_12990 [Leptobacterium flavescens]|uniref:Putative zinc-finger domain-containing protein n=1 Tax=Leptobacterium flavescens TaxID=472055 RepID=A0A6P0UPF0_9FLAO|nr:HEAT repeat domain-containing protein [Leptobacterium flavescens]NER14362.1 hypothetical protein [Leptobacterium flavescens]
MKCKEIESRLIDFIDRNLDDRSFKETEDHLEQCTGCREALEEFKTIFCAIDNAYQEVSDPQLRADFEKMLEREKELVPNQEFPSFYSKERNSRRPFLQLAASIALILMSYFFGKYQDQEEHTQEVADLEKEKTELKTEMTISMIENGSASKRLQAVSYAGEFQEPGDEILQALTGKMFNDEHVNVRLAAAEALMRFSDSQEVRKTLIEALEKEQDPSMQIELIHMLVEIKEKRAVPVMKALLQKESTASYVKEQLNISLEMLI